MPTDVHFCRDIDFNLATGGLNEVQVLEQFVVGSESYCNLYLMVMMIIMMMMTMMTMMMVMTKIMLVMMMVMMMLRGLNSTCWS